MLKHFAFAAAIGLGATGAAATTLTFDGNICNGGMACPSTGTANIDQSYGDVTGQLDVVYDGATTVSGLSPVRFVPSMGDLTNVSIGTASQPVEIFLQPVGGASITLLGFDLAGST